MIRPLCTLPPPRARRRAAAAAWLLAVAAGVAAAAPAAALPDDVTAELQRLAAEAALHLIAPGDAPPRVEVQLGALDARLALAPCQRIVPFVPPGTRPLGRMRMGLRCDQGAVPWRVTVPVEVRLWSRSLVARSALPAGTVLAPQHLETAEVDLAARADAAIAQPAQAVGRTLARGLGAGDALRAGDLRVRQFFNAGDTVRVIAVGAGFAVSSEGQALVAGQEGRNAAVRLESGRIVTGVATGERRVEVAL